MYAYIFDKFNFLKWKMRRNKYLYFCENIFNHLLSHEHDVTQGHFLTQYN